MTYLFKMLEPTDVDEKFLKDILNLSILQYALKSLKLRTMMIQTSNLHSTLYTVLWTTQMYARRKLF